MSKSWFILLFLILFLKLHAQENEEALDLKYLEDQLYISLTYDIIIDMPSTISQNGFSGGGSFGFIKDIPINEKRNFGIGVGLGYAYNTYIQNLKVLRENGITVFETAQNYKTNRLGISALEIPIEIRWRNSTPKKYKFFRAYGGIKFSYVLSAKTLFEDVNGRIRTNNIPEINKIQYGLTLATGFSTWNLYVYYGLTSFFENASLNGESLGFKDLSIGLKFYIM